MDEPQRKAFTEMFAKLRKSMDPDAVAAELLSANMITEGQHDDVESKTTTSAKNSFILKCIMHHGNPTIFDVFVKCLKEADQAISYLADELHGKDTDGPCNNEDFLDKMPSDVALGGIIKIIPLWQDLAIALGVPLANVTAFASIGIPSMQGVQALQMWQSGHFIKKGFPTTWRFLLKKIEEVSGPMIRDKVARKAKSQKSWSRDNLF